ncbi:MAG: thrombospondin type 3 repeat-containing protein, partial [Bacteroidales bacterium]
MIRYLLVFLFLLIGVVKLPAQSIHHPWILSFGNSYTDFHLPVKSDLSAIFTSADWMGAHVPMSIRAGIRLSNSFTFSAVSSATKLEPEKLNTIPLQDPVNNELFWKAGGQLEYKLANGYLLRTTSKVDPYLLIGANGTRINEEIHFSQSVGVGINLWLSRQVGINFQGTYDRINDFNDYTHFIVGIVTRVGNMADRDRDGVPNKLDKCPTVAGVKHLDGCPDYDMDGITDSLDRCPRVYGPIESDGCPDFDLDGVPDHED